MPLLAGPLPPSMLSMGWEYPANLLAEPGTGLGAFGRTPGGFILPNQPAFTVSPAFYVYIHDHRGVHPGSNRQSQLGQQYMKIGVCSCCAVFSRFMKVFKRCCLVCVKLMCKAQPCTVSQGSAGGPHWDVKTGFCILARSYC